MTKEKNILDDVFSRSEEELETFMEAVKENIGQDDMGDFHSKFDDKEIGAETPDYITQESGNIRITHGWHGTDYVWHMSTKHPKIPFKVDAKTMLYTVAKTMNDTIPSSVEVKIWLPLADWDIQEYTFKAVDLKSSWQITQKAIEALNLKLFNVLNTMV
jgi:hypothetical protein